MAAARKVEQAWIRKCYCWIKNIMIGSQIAAVVVLYNPEIKQLDNILKYSGDVERVYVVDNSEEPDPIVGKCIKKIANAIYLPEYENKGIAKGLNTGMQKAMNEGYTWLLTIDQDSEVDKGMLLQMLRVYESCPEPERIGLISPRHEVPGRESKNKFNTPYIEKDHVMTSGNLVKLSVARKIGMFREDFFIDGVDIEYNFRMIDCGYKIIEVKDAVLYHPLGHERRVWWWLGGKRVREHSPVREYYMMRNYLYLWDQYEKHMKRLTGRNCKKYYQRKLIYLIAFNTQRIKKILAMYRGYSDYKKGVTGKSSWY